MLHNTSHLFFNEAKLNKLLSFWVPNCVSRKTKKGNRRIGWAFVITSVSLHPDFTLSSFWFCWRFRSSQLRSVQVNFLVVLHKKIDSRLFLWIRLYIFEKFYNVLKACMTHPAQENVYTQARSNWNKSHCNSRVLKVPIESIDSFVSWMGYY